LPPISGNHALKSIAARALPSLAGDLIGCVAPTSADPVNAMKRVFGVAPSNIPNSRPAARMKLNDRPRKSRFRALSVKFAATVGVSLDGLMHHMCLPVTSAATVFHHSRQRKMSTAGSHATSPAPDSHSSFSPGIFMSLLVAARSPLISRRNTRKFDGFRDVRFRLRPGFPRFENQPKLNLEFVVRGSAGAACQQFANAFLRAWLRFHLGEIKRSRFDRPRSQFLRGFLIHTDHFGGMRLIQELKAFPRSLDASPPTSSRLAASSARIFQEDGFHRAAIGRTEIRQRLIAKLG